jgi:hypothetical protein
MDTTTCKTSLDWMLFLDGYTAAKAGEPFASGQTDPWQEGYCFRLLETGKPMPPRPTIH